MGNLGLGGMLLVYVALFGAMYFFLIRPSSKKRKAEEEMRKNIAIGDEVTTIGGIVGRIVAIKDEEDAYIIETGSDRVKMKFKKWAISTVDTQKETTSTATDKEKALEEYREKKAKQKEEKLAKKEKAKAEKNK